MQKLLSFFIWLGVGLLASVDLEAQTRLEAGPYIGVSWYNGDLNPNRMFASPEPAYGGLAKYVFNDRMALRLTLGAAGISGSYPQKELFLPESLSGSYSFDRTLLDMTTMLEISLFPYDHPVKRDRSEEHTSELQSRPHLVCRLLLEKKKNNSKNTTPRSRRLTTTPHCTSPHSTLFRLTTNSYLEHQLYPQASHLSPHTPPRAPTPPH